MRKFRFLKNFKQDYNLYLMVLKVWVKQMLNQLSTWFNCYKRMMICSLNKSMQKQLLKLLYHNLMELKFLSLKNQALNKTNRNQKIWLKSRVKRKSLVNLRPLLVSQLRKIRTINKKYKICFKWGYIRLENHKPRLIS